MKRVEREIKQGAFDYAATFPASPKAVQFASQALPTATGVASAVTSRAATLAATPSFHDFSRTWRDEMAPQWRRLHRLSVDAIFDAHLLPAFGTKSMAAISKADVLAFRAKLAETPGRAGTTLAPATINKIMGILRQCLTLT